MGPRSLIMYVLLWFCFVCSRRGTYVVPPELMGDPSAVATETRHNNINNSRAMASVKGGANYPEQEEIIIDDQEDDDDEEEDQTDWQAKPKLGKSD